MLSTYNKYDTHAMNIDCTNTPPKNASHNLMNILSFVVSSSNSVVSDFILSPLELFPTGQSKPEDNLPAGQSTQMIIYM